MLDAIMAQVKENGFDIFIVRPPKDKTLPEPDVTKPPLRECQTYQKVDDIKAYEAANQGKQLNFDGADGDEMEAVMKLSMQTFQ